MKKLLCILAAAAVIASSAVTSFAAYSSVTVKNNVTSSRPVSYTYDSENGEEIVTSIKTLMTKLDDLTRQNDVVQTLTVTSDSADNAPVEISLRLSIPQTVTKNGDVKTPTSDEYEALDYYRIKVKAYDGSILFDDGDTQYSTDGEAYRDIPLGTFNETDGSESRTYNVALSVNKKLAKTAVTNNAKKLDWSLVSKAQTPAKPQMTDTPQEPEREVSETAAPKDVSEAKNGNVKLTAGDYTVGEDIKSGRYTVTGEGKIHVYTPENVLKTTIALKAKNDSSSNGVSEYVINLTDGERLVAESEIELSPLAAATPTPKPSATPKASSSSSSSSNATPKPSSTGAPKNNPKTGDSAPVAAVSILGVIALAGAVFITKKNKNN